MNFQALDEEEFNWGYAAYLRNELIGMGKVPVPDDIRAQATEIHWIHTEPQEELPVEYPPVGTPI